MVPAFGAVGLGIVGVLIWALIEPAANPDRPPAVAIDSGRESTARVALRPGLLRASFVAITWVSLAMGILHLLGPITLDGFGLTSAGIGWVFTVGSVLSVVAILTVARLSGRFERLRVVVRLVLVVGALSVAMIAPLGVWGYAIVLVAIIALSSPVFTVAYTLCADGARHAGIGEGAAFGVLNGLWATGAVISPIVAGVAEGGGVAPVAYALSAAIALGAALVIRRSSEPASAPA
jgi:MFS family permease